MHKIGCTSAKREQGNMVEKRLRRIIGTSFAMKTMLTTIAFIACCFSEGCSVEAKKRALLIGISDYPKVEIANASWNKIHGANDVFLLSHTLQEQRFDVQMLVNSQATAFNIRKALKSLVGQVTKGDLVYVHFSCHGQPFEDLSGDEDDGWDESVVPYDAQRIFNKNYQGERHILDDELERYINTIRTNVGYSGFVYVVLDACHMGGASRSESETEAEMFIRGTDCGFSPHSKKYIPKIDRRGHLKIKASSKMASICYIEACRSYQSNTEIKENNQYYGPLSFYINKSLSLITLSDNTNWVSAVVKQMAEDRRLIKQNPVIETDR